MAALAAIGAIASLGSAIYGAAKSSAQNKDALRLLERSKDKQNAWYNARRMEDYTQRADAQNVINKQRELLEQRYKSARAAGVVGGASEESVALQKEAANTAMANTMGDIAAQGAQAKENLEREQMQMNANYDAQQAQIKQQQANTTAAAASQAVNAGLNFVGNEMNAAAQKAAGAAGMPTMPTSTGVPIGKQMLENDIAASGATYDDIKIPKIKF